MEWGQWNGSEMDSDSGQAGNPATAAHLAGAWAKSGAAGSGGGEGVKWVFSVTMVGEGKPHTHTTFGMLSYTEQK